MAYSTELSACAVIVVVSTVAAVIDARTGHIPNWLTLPLIPLSAVLYLVSGGVAAFIGAVGGFLLTAFVPFALYRGTKGQAIGGGDLKLLGAIGAVGGPMLGLEIEFAAFLVLALLAMVRLAYQGKLLRVFGNALRLLVNPLLPRARRKPIVAEQLTEMRMGPAIALGALLVVATEHLQRWLPWLL